MNLSQRDRRTLIAGGVLAVLIILGTPLLRKWSDMGGALAAQRAEVARLRESTDGYEALVRHRGVLVSRLGSLLEPDAKDAKAAPATENPSDASEETPDAPEPPKDTEQEPGAPHEAEAPPPDIPETPPKEEAAHESVAGYVGRAANESGIKIKRVTPKKAPGSGAARSYFKPVTVQVTMETTAENLIKMLHALEQGGRFTHVDQIQLTRNLSKGDTIEVSLDVMAYEAGEG